VDFLAALIERLIQQYKIPPAQEGGKILMSGMSNGGSMAFRFNCEKAEMIGGKKPAPFFFYFALLCTNDHLTKRGSGQTQGKLKKEHRFRRAGHPVAGLLRSLRRVLRLQEQPRAERHTAVQALQARAVLQRHRHHRCLLRAGRSAGWISGAAEVAAQLLHVCPRVHRPCERDGQGTARVPARHRAGHLLRVCVMPAYHGCWAEQILLSARHGARPDGLPEPASSGLCRLLRRTRRGVKWARKRERTLKFR
jgi:hypothetical protein